jgi:hypothetical protein
LVIGLVLGLAPPAATDEDPFSPFEGVGPQLGLMLLLASIAVLVVWISRRTGKRSRTGRGKKRPGWADPQWRAQVETLRQSPTSIADAKPGDVCVIATLSNAPLSLGGPPEHACVWRNTMGSDASTAIAAELVFVADDTGRAALERLEHARVIAPPESAPGRGNERARRVAALYLGDKVEIIARFDIDKAGDDPDPRKLVYGTLGAEGPVEVRVIERPARPTPAPAPSAPSPSEAPSGPPSEPVATDEGSPT